MTEGRGEASEMLDNDGIVTIANALGDATRFKILWVIADAGEIDCGDVTELVGVAQSTVSHHVKILATVGLVRVRQAGQRSLYRIDRQRLLVFADALREAFDPMARLPELGWGVID